MGHDLLCYLIRLLLLDMTMELACIWTKCVWWSQTTLLPYLWTRVVITMWTPMYEVLVNYLWNWCNMWLVMLNHYDLGCMQVSLKSFVVSVDYRVYMGSSVIVWSLQWLLSYLCSYKLVGSVIADKVRKARIDLLMSKLNRLCNLGWRGATRDVW